MNDLKGPVFAICSLCGKATQLSMCRTEFAEFRYHYFMCQECGTSAVRAAADRMVELTKQLREAKAEAELAKAERNRAHVPLLAANRLLFEASRVMRRWGNLCHGEYQSLDQRIDEHLTRH
jgi:hypothetical protein